MWRLAANRKRSSQTAGAYPACIQVSVKTSIPIKPLISLYRKARAIPGVKKVLIASGLRYDLAVETPEYVNELVSHHVGGYLKIAPEHTETGPLSKMMNRHSTYDRFKAMFDEATAKSGKDST